MWTAPARTLVALEPAQLADRLNFGVPVRPSIGLQQVCKPKLRSCRVRVIPGVPRNVGLGLTSDQPPIDRTDVVPLRNWQDPANGTAQGPSQVLRAEDRPPQRGQLCDPGLEACWFVIAVEGDHIGVVQLD